MENFIYDNSELTEQQMAVADDAVPLCPDCLEPCDLITNYCPHCGSNEAINPLASYMPYVNIRFNTGMYGKLWRKCWHAQTPVFYRCLYISVAFLFYSIISVIGLPFLFTEKIQNVRIKRLYDVFCYIFAAALFLTLLWFRLFLAFQII